MVIKIRFIWQFSTLQGRKGILTIADFSELVTRVKNDNDKLEQEWISEYQFLEIPWGDVSLGIGYATLLCRNITDNKSENGFV